MKTKMIVLVALTVVGLSVGVSLRDRSDGEPLRVADVRPPFGAIMEA